MILATILLEPHRWRNRDQPILQWSDSWSEKTCAAGFDGLELWENHWMLADKNGRRSLTSGSCPVRIFNWYGHPGSPGESQLLEAVECLAGTLRGVKFNLAPGSDLQCGIDAASQLAERMPPGIRLLCECHAGTPMESPAMAREAFDQWSARIQAIVHPFSPNASPWWDALGSRITHLHLQANANGTWLDPIPGLPEVDEGLRLIKSFEFAGTASLEFIAGISQEPDPARLLSRAAKVRTALAELG